MTGDTTAKLKRQWRSFQVVLGLRERVGEALFYPFFGLPLIWMLLNVFLAWGLCAIPIDSFIDVQPSSCGNKCVFFFAGDASAATAMMSIVSNAAINVSTLTFSMTVLSVQLASQTYSPRLLDEFLKDSVAKQVLAVNLGAYVFCLIVQANTQTEDLELGVEANVPIVAVNMVLVHAAIMLVVFVMFVEKFVNGMRLESILHRASKSAWSAAIRSVQNDSSRERTPLPDVPPAAFRVMADTSGYVSNYVLEKALSEIIELDLVVLFSPYVGQFVTENTHLAWVWGRETDSSNHKIKSDPEDDNESSDEDEDESEEGMSSGYLPHVLGTAVEQRIRETSLYEKYQDEEAVLGVIVNRAVELTISREREEDVALGIQQLSDMAIRALSPGINDPQSAIQAMDSLSVVFGKLAKDSLPNSAVRDENGVLRLIAPARSFSYLLSLALEPIRAYGFQDVTVCRRAIRLLGDVGSICRRLGNEPRVNICRVHLAQWLKSAKSAFEPNSLGLKSVLSMYKYAIRMIKKARHLREEKTGSSTHREDDLDEIDASIPKQVATDVELTVTDEAAVEVNAEDASVASFLPNLNSLLKFDPG